MITRRRCHSRFNFEKSSERFCKRVKNKVQIHLIFVLKIKFSYLTEECSKICHPTYHFSKFEIPAKNHRRQNKTKLRFAKIKILKS